MDRIKPKKGWLSKTLDHVLKLALTAVFALWLFIPGLIGFLEAEVNTADVFFESFIFATDKVAGAVGVMISMARMLVALSIPAGLYRNDVSDLLGLDLYGNRTLSRLLFGCGALIYLISGFVSWLHLTGGF